MTAATGLLQTRARILALDASPAAPGTRQFLGAAGHKVERAARGNCTVVMLGVYLPPIDGLKVCRRLRNRADTAQWSTLARGGVSSTAAGIAAGADGGPIHPVDHRAALMTELAAHRPTHTPHRDVPCA